MSARQLINEDPITMVVELLLDVIYIYIYIYIHTHIHVHTKARLWLDKANITGTKTAT